MRTRSDATPAMDGVRAPGAGPTLYASAEARAFLGRLAICRRFFCISANAAAATRDRYPSEAPVSGGLFFLSVATIRSTLGPISPTTHRGLTCLLALPTAKSLAADGKDTRDWLACSRDHASTYSITEERHPNKPAQPAIQPHRSSPVRRAERQDPATAVFFTQELKHRIPACSDRACGHTQTPPLHAAIAAVSWKPNRTARERP